LILARPYRLRAETRSAYYLVRVLADPDADRERVRGPENAFMLAARHLAQAQASSAEDPPDRRYCGAGAVALLKVKRDGGRAGFLSVAVEFLAELDDLIFEVSCGTPGAVLGSP
jgi:hypothetical protein